MVLLKDILNQDTSEANNSKMPPDISTENFKKRSASLPSPNFSGTSSSNGNSDSDDEGAKCKLGVPPSMSHVTTPQSGTPSSTEEEHFFCKWDQCGKVFNQPELLYHHLCQDHVGRKSQRNLQLACKWGECNVKTEKRDHITSHLRVHVPLKPFDCSRCSKKFKRPQDLKKHLKVHAESHISVKKRRGPKLGSKRVQKKQKEELDIARSRFSSTSSSISSPSPTPDKNYSLPTLPRISFQQLISNEIPSYEPVYTQQLGTKLRTVLPSLGEEEALPRSPPSITQHAAGFFSTLSKNMSSSLPNQAAKQPIMATTGVPAVQPGFKHSSYPKVYQLPPIGLPPADVPSEKVSAASLPSLRPAPVLNSRYNNFERLPHFNTIGQYFSSNQKNSGSTSTDEEYLLEKISSLSVEANDYNEDDDEESQDILESLEIVNIIRDYLLCSLIEQEFEDENMGKELYQENFSKLSEPRKSETHNLSRYPQVVI